MNTARGSKATSSPYKLAARSRTEAVAELEQLRSEVRRGGLAITDRRMTVAQLSDRFLDALDADDSYSPRTREDVRRRLQLHIIPALGSIRVCDLDAHAVRRFARSLTANRAKTHRNVVSVLSSMLTWAVAEGFASDNAVTRARERFPRDLRRTDAERFQPRALTAEELGRSLAKVGPTYRPLVSFIAETGARISEALAVRFGDVDLVAGTWLVSGQLDDGGRVRAAKTPGSTAIVPLSKAALGIVREQRRKLMQRHGFAAASADAFVFTGRRGQPLNRRNALRAWQEATKAALDEPLRLHDLRTTFASRLAANNVDIATAQALMRHARPSTTLDIYTRVRGDAAARLERMRTALDG